MRFYFTLYGISSAFAFLLAGHAPTAYIFDLVPVIDLDLMSKMSAVIRRIINTTNAPAAIGPYRWELPESSTKGTGTQSWGWLIRGENDAMQLS